jgi:DNA-directed RNA polymerase subunit RPC12/RpoP
LAEENLEQSEKVPEACPHCGNKLSPWQQVLLATDRALVCRNCWYRIILDVIPSTKKTDSDKSKSKGSN